MKSRTILIAVLAIALVGICGLCALTGVGTYSWMRAGDMQLRFFNLDTASAIVTETRSFEVNTPVILAVETDNGDITVTAADVDDIEVEIIKKAWAESKAKAQTIAEGMEVDITQAEDQLTIAYQSTEPFGVISLSNMPDTVSFNILVPAKTSLILTAHHGGEVGLNGTSGSAEVRTSFGDVEVIDVKGSLTINNSNGDITIENVGVGSEAISMETSFGDITITGLTGGDVDIKTANGDIFITELNANHDLSVKDQFGDVEVGDFSSETLKIENQNGRINIESGQVSGLLEISDGFGDVSVLQVAAGQYALKTNNGEIRLDEANGEIDMDNSFGDIVIQNATNAVLDLKTNNGKVNFSGSLDESETHTLESSFGDIVLSIPSDSAFDIYLKTSFGEITSDMPVMITGNLSETEWKGTLNGGGESLRAETNNGDISLENLSSD
jgi:DUF4097 and DUF4098 domain-containing protein YvlB